MLTLLNDTIVIVMRMMNILPLSASRLTSLRCCCVLFVAGREMRSEIEETIEVSGDTLKIRSIQVPRNSHPQMFSLSLTLSSSPPNPPESFLLAVDCTLFCRSLLSFPLIIQISHSSSTLTHSLTRSLICTSCPLRFTATNQSSPRLAHTTRVEAS